MYGVPSDAIVASTGFITLSMVCSTRSRREVRHRREGAHAPCVRALVPGEKPLVVAGRFEGDDIGARTQRKHAHLRTVEEAPR